MVTVTSINVMPVDIGNQHGLIRLFMEVSEFFVGILCCNKPNMIFCYLKIIVILFILTSYILIEVCSTISIDRYDCFFFNGLG